MELIIGAGLNPINDILTAAEGDRVSSVREVSEDDIDDIFRDLVEEELGLKVVSVPQWRILDAAEFRGHPLVLDRDAQNVFAFDAASGEVLMGRVIVEPNLPSDQYRSHAWMAIERIDGDTSLAALRNAVTLLSALEDRGKTIVGTVKIIPIPGKHGTQDGGYVMYHTR